MLLGEVEEAVELGGAGVVDEKVGRQRLADRGAGGLGVAEVDCDAAAAGLGGEGGEVRLGAGEGDDAGAAAGEHHGGGAADALAGAGDDDALALQDMGSDPCAAGAVEDVDAARVDAERDLLAGLHVEAVLDHGVDRSLPILAKTWVSDPVGSSTETRAGTPPSPMSICSGRMP